LSSKLETILLVDDERNILDLARMYLVRDGFNIETSTDGVDALEKIRRDRPSLVVLDLMLPGMDGLEICRTLRGENNQVPIILLTARDEDVDKILGLELGADDYMTKPFNPRELSARVKAILRRSEQILNEKAGQEIIHVDDIVIDLRKREVRNTEGHQIKLRRHEFDLLKVLIDQKGYVLTRDQLLNQVWGFDFAGQTRTVDVHIAQLRNKLSSTKIKIETVTGIGYKLVE
jgi:two-component system, OmpR family, alkaline phosphatase synthesis response regulator PhoP